MEYYLKKTFRGMVLMKRCRKLSYAPGVFTDSWKRATEEEAQEFIAYLESLKEKEIIYSEIRDKNPELLI